MGLEGLEVLHWQLEGPQHLLGGFVCHCEVQGWKGEGQAVRSDEERFGDVKGQKHLPSQGNSVPIYPPAWQHHPHSAGTPSSSLNLKQSCNLVDKHEQEPFIRRRKKRS